MFFTQVAINVIEKVLYKWISSKTQKKEKTNEYQTY